MELNEDEKLIAVIASQNLNYPVQNIDANNLPLEFINANKLSLILEEQGIKIPIAEKERRKINILINELSEIKCVFDRYNVNFIVIKSLEKLPKPLGDVDVLTSDMRMAESALKQRGYTQETEEEPYKKLYVRKVNDERVAIHLHSEIAWREIKYLEKDEIFEKSTKRKTNAIYPAPCKELYDEEITPSLNLEYAKIKNLHHLFQIRSVISLRTQKIFSILMYFRIRKDLSELHAYALDTLDIFKERYGITSLKRRFGS